MDLFLASNVEINGSPQDILVISKVEDNKEKTIVIAPSVYWT